MNKEQALSFLGLESGATDSEIDAVYQRRKSQTIQKLESAPTDALKAKFGEMSQQLDDAREVLLANSAAQTPAQNSGAPSLSATKLADLPNAGPGLEGEAIQISIGQQLAGRYEVREQIGAGGMGAVYRALDSNTGQEIALKVLLPSLARNERARERFLDEARISQKLSHPNIVNVYDVEQDGDLVFLTMELLEGQDLREVMENRKLARQQFTEAELKQLANQLCNALAYAHKHTVHRDLKPENVWLTEDGDYKLMDFGIARVQSTSQRTQTGAAMGTAYYMAPEQLRGQKDIDGRADQYALGVMLYELSTEQVPAGLIKPIRQIRKDLSSAFASTVMQTLNADPAERFADILVFNENLQKGGGISLPRFPWKGMGIAAAALVVAIAGGALVTSGNYELNLAALLPMSAAEKAQREAEQARLQGEIRVLKQRLETARRNLDSSVRDAERNNSSALPALRHWQTATENAIFNSSIIGELEGRLSMAEALLKQGQYDPAESAYTDVKVGYEKLNADFSAGERLYAADQEAQKAKADWHAFMRKYSFTDYSPSAEQAQAHYDSAEQHHRTGELQAALPEYQSATANWRNAPDGERVQAQVKRKEAEWAKVAAQNAERERQAAAKKAERERRAALAASFSLVDIPAGQFQMGSGDPGHRVKTVTIKAFRMMAHEVTFAQWDACVAAGGCKRNPNDEGWGRGNRPVMNVSWTVITEQFIPWLNKSTGQEFRLPTEAEWEYAARAGTTTAYSTGNCISTQQANFDGTFKMKGCPTGQYRKQTVPIKSFAPNAFGLYDMHGNIEEWVQDCWNGSIWGAPGPSDGSAWLGGDCKRRVYRGGSWFNNKRSADRSDFDASASSSTIGFRLAQDH